MGDELMVEKNREVFHSGGQSRNYRSSNLFIIVTTVIMVRTDESRERAEALVLVKIIWFRWIKLA